MPTNEHGLEATGSNEAIRLFDQATDALAHFESPCTPLAAKAVAVEPGFTMGHVLNAYLLLLSTESADRDEAQQAVAKFRAHGGSANANDRERQHMVALDQWLRGQWMDTSDTLLDLQQTYPRDLLALVAGHQLDIFQGNLKRLRDRVRSALPAWEGDRHEGVVMGMYAFGLEECGDYGPARDMGYRAVELDRRDAWGMHAVAHTYEMLGDFRGGAGYLEDHANDWAAESNFFKPHTWWHYCLYELEAGNRATALAIFDRELHNEHLEPVAMRMLDASALLWRLYLQGEDETARWRSLAQAWLPSVDVPNFAFNDVHAVMAFVGAGDLESAQRLLDSRRRYVAAAPTTLWNQVVNAKVGLRIYMALIAFGQEKYATVADLLYPIRKRLHAIGGSDAQRDAIQQTLVEAALRAGQVQAAQELIDERMIARPASPYNWLKLANLRRLQGDPVAAEEAELRSAEYAAADPAPR